MTKVIIIGHGLYGTLMKSNIEMLVGNVENFYFLDFNKTDDLDILKKNINKTIEEIKDSSILFACDLTGGSPFREACIKASENQNYATVGGLNTAGYCELSYNLELDPKALAEIGVDATKQSTMIYSID